MKHYAEINLIDEHGEFITLYPDVSGPAGMPLAQVRAAGERAALAEAPGARVVGSRVTNDGNPPPFTTDVPDDFGWND